MQHLKSVTGSNSVTLEGMQNGEYYAHTTFYDDDALEKNNKIRTSGMLDKGKLGLHDDEDIRFAISVPSVLQWNMFKKKHLETYKLLTSKNSETDRMKGARQLQILEPAWVVFDRL